MSRAWQFALGVAAAIAACAGVASCQRTPPASPNSTASDDSRAPELYKWRDDQGVWNYTDTPPSDRPYETISGTPNVNSLPSVVPDNGAPEPNAPPLP